MKEKIPELKNITEEIISNIDEQYTKIIKTYEHNEEIIKQCQDRTTDILHNLEWTEKIKPYEGFKIVKEIMKIRKMRRFAKDQNIMMKEAYDWAVRNKTLQGQLAT